MEVAAESQIHQSIQTGLLKQNVPSRLLACRSLVRQAGLFAATGTGATRPSTKRELQNK
jgi:hypothetical protein